MAIVIAAVIVSANHLARGDGTVTDCSEASLRAAMAGGGTVTFACDGTIAVANTISVPFDTVLDGRGHQVTINGGNAVRLFYVATNVNFTALNLAIAHGQSTSGAGVLNDGGKLVFTSVAFLSNVATNSAPPGTNAASCGGAICSRGGSVKISNCIFTGNQAFGSASDWFNYFDGTAGGDGCGAAIYSVGQLDVEGSTFVGNLVAGGVGESGLQAGPTSLPTYAGVGGSGDGGAIYILGAATVSDSTFVWNVAGGGCGGLGGMGVVEWIIGGSGSPGGAGGSANGAALFNGGTLTLVNCTIVSNTAAGGDGGDGGMGGVGQFGGSGGWGGTGGDGFAGICDFGLAAIINCTISANVSHGGAGGLGGSGGMGPYGNGSAGLSGADGIAAGGLRTVGGSLLNTLFSANVPTNCSGTITDAGHNLSSDASCAFTNVGSMNNTDPQLGSLSDNGGPTLTMALLPGSPAIDAGSAAGAPATDQRGVPRPQGAGVDIGAFEFLYTPVFTGATIENATNRQMQLSGLTPNQSLTLQASTNLVNWYDLTNFTAGANGAFQCFDSISGIVPKRFYRLKAVGP